MQNPYIIGKKLYLRGLKKEDLAGNMFQWANDPEVTYYMFMGHKPNTKEALEEEYERIIRSEKDVVLAIIDKKTDAHIGNAGLYDIKWIYRSAEYRVVIGEKKFWNKGYGTEAGNLVLDYGFNKLNLNKIWLGVNADHKSAIKSYQRSGFVKEGILRQEIYRNGRYYDAVRMSILRKEFDEKKS